MSKGEARSELRWVLLWAAIAVLVSSVPYIYGAAIAPNGEHFLGLTHNIDDGAVYLSWMRQAADGHFFIRNLFTNEPQLGRQFNVLMLVMGVFGRLTHIPLIWVFHLFRVLFGGLLIVVIWRFAKLFLSEPGQRRFLVPLVAFSGGLGWVLPWAMQTPPNGSVDMWQPEALTFPSIYLNPLFIGALILMLCAFHELILAEREGRARHAIHAGLWLLILGNVHTYDVITVACVWAAYLVVRLTASFVFRPSTGSGCSGSQDAGLVVTGDAVARVILLSLLAAAIALPSVGYQLWLYHADKVLYARANSAIWSPPVWSFFTGYGLVLIGALASVVLITCRRRFPSLNIQHSTFILVWSVVGFAIPYIPVGQQRKLVMGLHVPLCILCACAAVYVFSRFRRPLGSIFLAMLCVLAAESNLVFMSRDMGLLAVGRTCTHYFPYMPSDDLSAMRWLRENTKPNDTVFAPPTFSLFVPAMIGHQVYYGHWSETPDYEEKITQWEALAQADYNCWINLVAYQARARYYVSITRLTDPPRRHLPDQLTLRYSAGATRVYGVRQVDGQ